jgi:pyruvate formate lyase activating enzyme
VSPCRLCGETRLVAEAIGVCAACLRSGSAKARTLAARAHARTRAKLGLPRVVPKSDRGGACAVCANGCRPAEGKTGLCGARETVGGKVRPIVGTAKSAAVTFWHDALPTNCTACFACAGSSKAERGHQNLAVAYHGCTFDCLYCQSWQARHPRSGELHSAEEVAGAVDAETTCLVYFGGDPTPQLAHAVAAARIARKEAAARKRPLRICFETNGAMSRSLLKTMVDLSLESGGCIKFDLKAWDPNVHLALTGSSNERTLENFAYLASRRHERPKLPLAVAATALVPGYVDVEEIRPMARHLATLGEDMPWALLGFFSCFELLDLPNSSKQQARRCLRAAKAAGMGRARISNVQVLRDAPEGK